MSDSNPKAIIDLNTMTMRESAAVVKLIHDSSAKLIQSDDKRINVGN